MPIWILLHIIYIYRKVGKKFKEYNILKYVHVDIPIYTKEKTAICTWICKTCMRDCYKNKRQNRENLYIKIELIL